MSTVVAPSPSEGVQAQVSDTSVPVVADPQNQRLAGLDGVRGLAAFYVLVFHIFLRVFPGYPGGLSVDLPLPAAVAAYYRSVFLTLPGGIVGDLDRGVSHGRDVIHVGRGLRSVGCERLPGEVVRARALAVTVGQADLLVLT